MKLLRRIITIIVLIIPVGVFASTNYDIDNRVSKVYSKFYYKINQKYKYDNGLSYLHKLRKTLNKIKDSSKLNSKNYKIINDLQKLNNEKIFYLELIKKEKNNKIKIEQNPLLKDYNKFFYNNDGIVKKDGVWYAYIFDKKYYFENIYSVDEKTLEYNGLKGEDILVYHDDKKLNFVKKYRKEKLISDDIIYGIPNKYDFLKTLKNNKFFQSGDDDLSFRELKDLSINLSKGIYRDREKIEKIYSYIIENTDYSKNFTLQDYHIFSGIETYKNKNGVCEGYTELLNIILSFNNIESEIITGDVINAQDFPKIGHAWIKIGDYYYDPTFDDPIGAKKDSEKNNPTFYLYYKLPKDLFYTNRYNYGNTPEGLKTTTNEFRENQIKQNLSKLTSKYKSKNYNLLKPFTFREEHGIKYNEDLTINKLVNIIGENKMEDFSLELNGKTKKVKNISYITLDDENIELFLKQINFDLSGYILIKWIKDDSNTSYIISKNITYQ